MEGARCGACAEPFTVFGELKLRQVRSYLKYCSTGVPPPPFPRFVPEHSTRHGGGRAMVPRLGPLCRTGRAACACAGSRSSLKGGPSPRRASAERMILEGLLQLAKHHFSQRGARRGEKRRKPEETGGETGEGGNLREETNKVIRNASRAAPWSRRRRRPVPARPSRFARARGTGAVLRRCFGLWCAPPSATATATRHGRRPRADARQRPRPPDRLPVCPRARGGQGPGGGARRGGRPGGRERGTQAGLNGCPEPRPRGWTAGGERRRGGTISAKALQVAA